MCWAVFHSTNVKLSRRLNSVEGGRLVIEDLGRPSRASDAPAAARQRRPNVTLFIVFERGSDGLVSRFHAVWYLHGER